MLFKLLRCPNLLAVVCLCVGHVLPAWADVPKGLPRYELDIHLDLDQHFAIVHERVTWTNRYARPASELIFNAHSHFKLPEKDIGLTAKMVEILRMMPSQAFDAEGDACRVQKVVFIGDSQTTISEPVEIPFQYAPDNDTALIILPSRPVAQGESITIEIEFVMRLPQKMGRWGQWEGVTFLSNWLPVLAYYDDQGWQPTPFVPWHQPFFNEAGVYDARITFPCDQKVACTGSVVSDKDLDNGLRQLTVHCDAARDFAFLCSARYQEYTCQAGSVRVRCLAFPEHEHYARVMVQAVCDAIPVYNRWFGTYPYPEFTIVESFFGWNGNECSQLAMIDERIFSMPHAAERFVVYLVSHETCHQWWYNVVGTNGYCETWMDEGLATYFSNRLMNERYGVNNELIEYPRWLRWLPNVRRDDYRHFGLYGTIGRGEASATIQPMPGFGHIVNLFSMCYDKGSKIVGMIEDRLGEAAFFDFMRLIYRRYQFRILRVADFQRELEDYTGQSWQDFFQNWLYGQGLSDWRVDKVKIRSHGGWKTKIADRGRRLLPKGRVQTPCSVTVFLSQTAEINEQTVLGICLDGSDQFQIRVPIVPQVPVVEIGEIRAQVTMESENCARVDIELPCRPTQIAVDPDHLLVDRNPANNTWLPRIGVRFSPVFTFLDETSLTNAYDRWSVVYGPWVYTPTFVSPWFTRESMFGARAGLYRTERFSGGVYTAYRTNYRDIVAGADATWQHCPWDHTEFGLIVEHRLAGAFRGEEDATRGVLFGRYIIDYGDSLYLQPFHFVEIFATLTDNFLPDPRQKIPGSERFKHQALAGIHHHINYLTPYWDAEGGFQMDTSYQSGVTVPRISDASQGTQMLTSQIAWVKSMPEGWGWLSTTRWAFRLYGAVGAPARVEFFPLGGSELFRGFDLAQRQGSIVWVGSLEWRVPIAQHLHWDCVDHAIGVRNIYAALFCDIGDAYLRGRSIGGMAEALGAGMRVDLSWFAFVERTMLRLDTAKAVNTNTPWQFWLGLEHPF